MILDPKVADVPRIVADKLARKCWSVTRDDLRQEAEAAALHALQHFNPEKGDLRGYLWRSVARHLTNFMWEQGSPVSYKHRRNELRNTSAVDVDKAASVADELDVVRDVGLARWRAQVLERVVQLAGEEARLVAPCLLDAETPSAVAKSCGVPLLMVLDAVGRLREIISEDETMKQLYEEMP